MKSSSVAAVILICVLSAAGGGCSKQSGTSENDQNTWTPQSTVAALAKQYACPNLDDEIPRFSSTNSVYAIHIQRALKKNSRFATDCKLYDLIQDDEKIEAVFEIERMDRLECVAKLECPTNLVPLLCAQADEWALVFEPSHCTSTVNISHLVDGDEVVPVTALIVDGKLLAVEKEY